MKNKIYGYVRVSTQYQNIDRQRVALKEYADKNNIDYAAIFEDKASGKDFDRKQYQALKEVVRPGDTIVIKELDRLGRNMEGIKTEWNDLRHRGIDIVIIDNDLLSTKNKSDLEQQLISNIVFELLSYMAEKERLKLKQRTKEGLQRAKEKGIRLGRPERTLPDNFEKYYNKWHNKEITGVEFSKLLEVSRATLYRYIKEYEAEKGV